jgi:DNA-directed RNA polymerase specialized sigma24 family protein
MLGVPVGTVKSRLSRALGALRSLLEEDRDA